MQFTADTQATFISVLFIIGQISLFILFTAEAICAAQYSKGKSGFIFGTWFLNPKDYPGGEQHCRRGFIYAVLMSAGFVSLHLWH